MPPYDRRFGSPYDPMYSGRFKIERPQEQQDTAHLRGCGDPDCAMCNPETANRRNSGAAGTNNRPSGRPGGRDPRDEMMGIIASAIASDLGRNIFASDPPKPSTSYTQARKAVEKWIVKAPEQAFDDIIGNDDALSMLKDAVRAPVEHKDLYEAYGMKMPRGALLSGPPGCGKTMFARAAASEMKRLYGGDTEFISLSGAEIQSMYVGETEGHIKAIFTFAREYKDRHGHPLLVFIDEAEVLLPDRTGRVRRVAPWEESQVATFLAEMDGIRESGAFVMLATNRPEVIDQAVLRDGRCDFKIVVKRPTPEAIEVIIRKSFGSVKLLAQPVEELVFAAVEGLRDPSKVILSAHALKISGGNKVKDCGGRSFLLEHIVSGAMAASIPGRAVRHAFQRDKASSTRTGVTVDDVLRAANDLFAENRGLDHSFYLREFVEAFGQEMQEAEKTKPQ